MTTVRPVTASDAARWRELFRAYGEFYETDFTDEVLDAVWALMLDVASGVNALVAERDGEVIGLAHWRTHPDTFTGGRDGYLDDLFVDPEVRGTGAGRALIEAVAERAVTPGGTLRWITAETNTTAQALYDRIATRTTWLTYEMRG
ncbi:GNAT family N-acetyltransferase [Homoserinibacter sp. GY 40078]|uniref:GNAT family N-acetyltransferase n=1 Tax=Homoserinibacter sp. GY 40078 TaxID=2603275 RepID=UPI0011CB5FF9|nr:GNAT family N-acetyltransferase [Homoserinibacter sp. GY 40078]TXK19712.1 GNAT family N-acetyltransferase [Homoserinibacter sp. GY 40078]